MEGDLGYAGRFSLSYRDPVWWEVSTWGGATDKNFDVNALGFMRRNNNWDFGFRSQIRRDNTFASVLDAVQKITPIGHVLR